MGYFRPVQAVNKPHSFPFNPTESIQRGCFLWYNTSGYATTTKGSNAALGISDDNSGADVYGKIVNQEIRYQITTNGSGNGSASYSLGRTIAPDSIISSPANAKASWTVSFSPSASPTTSQFTLVEDGTLTHSITGADANTTYTVTLKLSYSYVISAPQVRGMTMVSDMFNNNSTAASQLITVWFMNGIYESDQYDPYVTYSLGGTLYAKDGGLFTSSSSGTTEVGVITKVPSANWNAETKTTLGHTQPNPEVVQFLMRL